MAEDDNHQKLGKAERDIVALGIAAAAIILFVATGSSVLPRVAASIMGTGAAPDNLLVNAMLLNIALMIFGWRRYRDLTSEIAVRKQAEEIARKLAETDPLTNCLNRRSIGSATEKLRRMANARGQATAFVMIDLDNFKQVNDMNGHGMGDKVLTVMAKRLRDAVPDTSPVARLGDGLQMPITAEGIENEDILAQLREMGELKGQGYHYGRPEDASQVLERLADNGKLAKTAPVVTKTATEAVDDSDAAQEQRRA